MMKSKMMKLKHYINLIKLQEEKPVVIHLENTDQNTSNFIKLYISRNKFTI